MLPGPDFTLSPDLVLTLVLPSLPYSAALDASLGAIRRNLRTVSLVTLIQGEGMLNDAKAPTILGFAITAATGGDFSAPGALGAFLLSLRILERELDHEEGLLPARTPV